MQKRTEALDQAKADRASLTTDLEEERLNLAEVTTEKGAIGRRYLSMLGVGIFVLVLAGAI